jgi:flavin reductase (DIM6/NTAB) family NADH-FMN oxidoreductase RutF
MTVGCPQEQQRFRDAISLLATGVTVITTATPDGPAGMTASAVCSLSLEPVALLVCISRALPTHRALERSGTFAVNVLGESQVELARRFATRGADRFAGLGVREVDGVPILDDAIAHFACRVAERFPGGDHSIFIGHVEECGHAAGSRPLLYYGRAFGALEPPEHALLRAWVEGGATA